MKRKVVLLALALMLVATGVVSAAANWGKFEGYNIVKLVINGKEVVPKDTPPVILKGRTMVPLSMLEEAGLQTDWDGNSYTVYLESYKTDRVKAHIILADIYKNISDLSVDVQSNANSLNLAFDYIIDKNSTIQLDNANGYMNNHVDRAIDMSEYVKSQDNYLKHFGLSNEAALSLLDDIFDSLLNFVDASEFLLNYSSSRSLADFNNFQKSSMEGFTIALTSRTSSNTSYANALTNALTE